jgi:hypothetical protein
MVHAPQKYVQANRIVHKYPQSSNFLIWGWSITSELEVWISSSCYQNGWNSHAVSDNPPVLRFQDSKSLLHLPLLAYNNLETLTDELQPVLSSDIRHSIYLEIGPWFVCCMLIKNTSFWFVMWGSTDCLSAIYCHWSVAQLASWLAWRHQVSINFATPAPQKFAGTHHYPLP